ncbi:hypothetical protein GJ496_005070 [Pomphorhynchus laevis]|nr:hypothetical protein GJ496_005070 [Pomphorhynchus laevis]
MGKSKDKSDDEKYKIMIELSKGVSTLQISKIIKRDHRTVKQFLLKQNQPRTRTIYLKIEAICTMMTCNVGDSDEEKDSFQRITRQKISKDQEQLAQLYHTNHRYSIELRACCTCRN